MRVIITTEEDYAAGYLLGATRRKLPLLDYPPDFKVGYMDGQLADDPFTVIMMGEDVVYVLDVEGIPVEKPKATKKKKRRKKEGK